MTTRLLFIVLFAGTAVSADTLTIAQAVEIGLQNNFSIRISRNTTEKSYNTRKLKTGALFPTVRLDAGASSTRTGYKPETPPAQTSGSSSELHAAAALNWTLFDGFKMFYTGRQIDRQIDLSELSARYEIEAATVAIMTAYYHLIAQRSLLSSALQQLAISQSQMQFLDAQYEFGRVGKRELLSQQVTVNTDSSTVLTRSIDMLSALHALNLALGRAPDVPVEPAVDSSVNNPEHDAAWWYYETLKHNTGLKIASVKKHIAATQLAIARASLWPVVAAGGTITGSAAQPADFFRSRGEITLSFPLFSGFSRITAIENAAIDTQNAGLAVEELRLELQAHVYEQWERLRNSRDQVVFEQQTILRASQSLELSKEQFRLGRISDIQLREAQLALLNAQVRYQSALFQNKVVALQLEQLAGKLVIPQ